MAVLLVVVGGDGILIIRVVVNIVGGRKFYLSSCYGQLQRGWKLIIELRQCQQLQYLRVSVVAVGIIINNISWSLTRSLRLHLLLEYPHLRFHHCVLAPE